MGRPTDPNFWQQSPPPQTGDMNNERTLNQRFMRELPGALPPQDVIIHDGAISGFESAALIVDTEGEAAADELNVINIVLSANENLHPGMIITLRAKDQARTVTVKNSAAANGINTAGGHDVVLSTEWDLVLRLVAGRWYEIQTRGDVRASDAQKDASTALARTAPATTTSRGIGRVATLADMEPGAAVENGPAFLSVGGGVVTQTPTAHAVVQADANGKLDGGWLRSSTLVAPGVVQLSSTVSSVEETKAATPKGVLNALKEKELSTRNVTGNWTITGVIVGIPLRIAMRTPSGSDNDNISIVAVSGATDMQVTTNNWPWSMGRSTTWSSGNSLWVLPTSSTVVLNLTRANTLATAVAYQMGHGG